MKRHLQHEALVDDELFQRVQSMLKGKRVSKHYTQKIDHPLRGFLRCAHCHRVYTPYEKKGHLYFYSRCLSKCPNEQQSYNLSQVSEAIRNEVSKLHFSDQELEEIEARASTDIALLEEERHKEISKLERRKKRVRDDLAYLNANRLALLKSGAYTPDSYMQEQQRLNAELEKHQQKEIISDEAMRDLMKEVVALSELIKNAVRLYDLAEPPEKERIARYMFSELFLSHDEVSFSLQKGMEPFADHLRAVGCPIEWLSELHQYRDNVRRLSASLMQLSEDTNLSPEPASK